MMRATVGVAEAGRLTAFVEAYLRFAETRARSSGALHGMCVLSGGQRLSPDNAPRRVAALAELFG
ncbi:hypothetical protein ABI214_03840 [Prescottella soli]|uniref:Uncharacterized protein n=1 Tax=Prescottella soli TaxID=1543852 RepID=A0ABW9FWT5_9NOCA